MSTDAENATVAATASSSSKLGVSDVVVHPLVLLSAADHYHRVARGTRKRVVGVLLGQVFKGRVEATNSFAVPFEEDSRNPAVFYLDHNYLENMLLMFRKVNMKERVVGFYSTGPQIRPNDLRIYDIVSRFCATTVCVFCIIDIRPNRPDLPVTAYKVIDQVDASRTFDHVPIMMGAQEAEEVGVEHLLRDINDPTVSTVASLITGKLAALDTLVDKLQECQAYLQTTDEPMPEIVDNLQIILNLLPNLNTAELVQAFLVKTNDMHMAIYLGALIRSILALHDLVNNKIRYSDEKEEQDGTTTAAEEKKEEKKDSKK